MKGNLSSEELTLDEYMGQIGSLAFTIGRTRHNQNYSEIDFEKEVIETGTDLGITVNIGKKTQKKRTREDVIEVAAKTTRRAPLVAGRKG